MSIARTLHRQIRRSQDRMISILGGKSMPTTKRGRVALAGNNKSIGNQVKKLQTRSRKAQTMARALTACLIRAVGGEAEAVLQIKQLDAYKARIHMVGTTISIPTSERDDGADWIGREHYYVNAEAAARKPGKSHFARESLHQRVARRGMAANRVAVANERVLAELRASAPVRDQPAEV